MLSISIALLALAICLHAFVTYVKRPKPIMIEYYSHDMKIECKYVLNPRLENPDDLFFDGAGPNWDEDLDGNRYRKIYDPKKISGHDVLEDKLEPGCTVPSDYTDLPFLN
jgi:hypothetical protein